MFAALVEASAGWDGVKITAPISSQLDALRTSSLAPPLSRLAAQGTESNSSPSFIFAFLPGIEQNIRYWLHQALTEFKPTSRVQCFRFGLD